MNLVFIHNSQCFALDILVSIDPNLTLNSAEKLLGMASDLGAAPRPNVCLDLFPVLTEKVHRFIEYMLSCS